MLRSCVLANGIMLLPGPAIPYNNACLQVVKTSYGSFTEASRAEVGD